LVAVLVFHEVRIGATTDTGCPLQSPNGALCQAITGEVDARIFGTTPEAARTALLKAIQDTISSGLLRGIGFVAFPDPKPVPSPSQPIDTPTISPVVNDPGDGVVILGTTRSIGAGTIAGISAAAGLVVILAGAALFEGNRKKRQHVEEVFARRPTS